MIDPRRRHEKEKEGYLGEHAVRREAAHQWQSLMHSTGLPVPNTGARLPVRCCIDCEEEIVVSMYPNAPESDVE